MADSTDRGRLLPAAVLVALVVVGTVVAGAAFAQSNDAPSGETILDNANHQYRSANTLTGTADVTVSNATENRSATVEYAFAKPHSARLAVTHNGTTATMGTNGDRAWVSAPALGVERTLNTTRIDSPADACRVLKDRASAAAANRSENVPAPATANASPAMTPSAIDCDAVATKWADANHAAPNRSDANLTATRTGSATVDGTDAYVVSIHPENRSTDVNTTVWVAKNDSRVLEGRVTDGTNATTVRFHDQHFNVSVDDSTFAPPTARATAGTTTYDDFGALRANRSDLPELTADGFGFENATVTHAGGGTTVAQQYANDSTDVTLVSTTADGFDPASMNGSQVTVDGHDATVTSLRGRTVVAWSDGDTTEAVVTDESADGAVALANEVD